MVNLSGISFDHRMTEDTGASVVDVTRAWVVAREVFGFPALWAEIDALGGEVPLDVQLDLFLDCRRMVERGALWLLRHRRPPIDIAAAVAQFQPGHRRRWRRRWSRCWSGGWPTSCTPSRRRG